MAQNDKINPVTLDIVKDSLIAVSNEIFYAFAQTSMSPIIYETLDYASGIADAEGRLLTQGNGVTGFIGMISPMICAVVEKHGKDVYKRQISGAPYPPSPMVPGTASRYFPDFTSFGMK